jgi:hypothetical protein
MIFVKLDCLVMKSKEAMKGLLVCPVRNDDASALAMAICQPSGPSQSFSLPRSAARLAGESF